MAIWNFSKMAAAAILDFSNRQHFKYILLIAAKQNLKYQEPQIFAQLSSITKIKWLVNQSFSAGPWLLIWL